MINLVENAVRYTAKGETSLVIRTLPAIDHEDRARTAIEFELRDTGWQGAGGG